MMEKRILFAVRDEASADRVRRATGCDALAFGAPLLGHQWDEIFVCHRPVTDREREWACHLQTKMKPGDLLWALF